MYDCICGVLDTSSSTESPQRIDDRLEIDSILDQLPAADRELLWLRFAYRRPIHYAGPWPPTLDDIAQYLQKQFGHTRLSHDGLYARIRRALRRARHVATGVSFRKPRYPIPYQPHRPNARLPRS